MSEQVSGAQAAGAQTSSMQVSGVQAAGAKVMLGKPVADAVKKGVRDLVAKATRAGHVPKLATLRIGEDPASLAYERSLAKAAAALGIGLEAKVLDAHVSQAGALEGITHLNEDAAVDGVLIFRPVPAHLDEAALCNALAPAKDVDAAGIRSLASVFVGGEAGFAPATAEACLEMLDFFGTALDGRHVVVVGRSLVIGKPVGMLLLSRNATVTYCHSHTRDLASVTRSADIVICAVGKARFFDQSFFREGQVVLDVGINSDSAGAICGDVDFESASAVVGAITPVPRGVGSVSTSVLLRHVAQAACRSLELR